MHKFDDIFMLFRAGMERNFKCYKNGVTDTLNQPYDLKSIMHYGNKAFSKNGGNTIISRKYGANLQLGAKQEKLSFIDTKQLNQLYKCQVRSRRRLGRYYSKFYMKKNSFPDISILTIYDRKI